MKLMKVTKKKKVISCLGQPGKKLCPSIFIWKAGKTLILLAKSKTKIMVYSWFGDIICITLLHRTSFLFCIWRFELKYIWIFEINFLFETSIWSGISRKEKRRRYVKKLNLFIYSYIISYIISNAFFIFHNVSQREFLRFLSS